MRYAFAGDREISCLILKYLISKDHKPLALMISNGSKATNAETLIQLSGLDEQFIFRGNEFKLAENILKMKALNLDYIFGIHFPYIISSEVLHLSRVGFLNLHPAFLPYNKGWHTPSWAILEGEPYGATLHFMSEALDEGDIILQREMEVKPYDTANTLYARTLKLEFEIFKAAFPDLLTLNPKRFVQTDTGTSHLKKDLSTVQKLDLNARHTVQEVIDKLRALTTNNQNESAYFEFEGKKIGINICFHIIDSTN